MKVQVSRGVGGDEHGDRQVSAYPYCGALAPEGLSGNRI